MLVLLYVSSSSSRNGLQVTCLVVILCFSCKNLDLRLGFDLCMEEQDFIHKRKKVVAAALKNILHLEDDLQEDEVCGTASWELKVFCPTLKWM